MRTYHLEQVRQHLGPTDGPNYSTAPEFRGEVSASSDHQVWHFVVCFTQLVPMPDSELGNPIILQIRKPRQNLGSPLPVGQITMP